jgi:hypothetical protein
VAADNSTGRLLHGGKCIFWGWLELVLNGRYNPVSAHASPETRILGNGVFRTRVGTSWFQLYRVRRPAVLQRNLAIKVMLRILSRALLYVCFIRSSSGIATTKCEEPALRKEWRALGYDGQKDFTDAFKASFSYFGVVTLN